MKCTKRKTEACTKSDNNDANKKSETLLGFCQNKLGNHVKRYENKGIGKLRTRRLKETKSDQREHNRTRPKKEETVT